MVVEAEGRGLEEKKKKGRLSEAQKKVVQRRAIAFKERVVAIAQRKANGHGGSAFFPEVFRIAGELIEQDTDGFCDRAEATFEEIEAHGQEPQLDDDWIDELTGENDNFYFSTDSLVSELEPLPGRKRGRKSLSDTEVDRITREIENAIIDDDEGQSFEQAIAVAHSENVHDWIETIRKALENSSHGEVEFWALLELTHLRPTELFLGLLLGLQNWELGQTEFYGQVNVCTRGSEAEAEEGEVNTTRQCVNR